VSDGEAQRKPDEEPEPEQSAHLLNEATQQQQQQQHINTTAALHRVTWFLRCDGATESPGNGA